MGTVERRGLSEFLDRLGEALLLYEYNAKIQPRVKVLWIYFKDNSELLPGFVKALTFEVLDAEVVPRHQIIRVDRYCLIQMADRTVDVSFANQLPRPFELFPGRGGNRPVGLGRVDDVASRFFDNRTFPLFQMKRHISRRAGIEPDLFA